jgi:hypothetical protein
MTGLTQVETIYPIRAVHTKKRSRYIIHGIHLCIGDHAPNREKIKAYITVLERQIFLLLIFNFSPRIGLIDWKMAELFSPPQNNRLASQAQPKSLQKMSTINWRVKNLWQKRCYSLLFKIIEYHVQNVEIKYMFFQKFSLFDGPFKIFFSFLLSRPALQPWFTMEIKIPPPMSEYISLCSCREGVS